MKSCGIIAEYHPFHNGHAYHLQKAKAMSQADVMVVVMSGNFMQRGEPALINKHYRTQLALTYGADIVIELPWFYAVQAADLFGKGAVELLGAMKVDSLCFGTEGEASFDYREFAKKEKAHEKELNMAFQQVKQAQNLSYPQCVAKAYQHVFLEDAALFEHPNHLLGMAYARANEQLAHPMSLYTLCRKQAHHRSHELGNIASGTAIRQAVMEQMWSDVKQSVPSQTYAYLQEAPLHEWSDYFPLLKYNVLISSPQSLANIYQMTEGLEYRFKKAATCCQTFDEWLDFLATSRYTKARIQRLSTYVLTNTTNEEVVFAQNHPYIKILGMNYVGQQWLKETSCSLPIISNIRQQCNELKNLEEKYERIYTLGQRDTLFQETYHPLITKENHLWNNNEKYRY